MQSVLKPKFNLLVSGFLGWPPGNAVLCRWWFRTSWKKSGRRFAKWCVRGIIDFTQAMFTNQYNLKELTMVCCCFELVVFGHTTVPMRRAVARQLWCATLPTITVTSVWVVHFYSTAIKKQWMNVDQPNDDELLCQTELVSHLINKENIIGNCSK